MDYQKLTDAIYEALNFQLTELNMNKVIEAIRKEYSTVRIKVHGEKGDENAFFEAAKPMMKYLCENCHPHVTVIIDGTRAELMEGLKTAQCEDYIR